MKACNHDDAEEHPEMAHRERTDPMAGVRKEHRASRETKRRTYSGYLTYKWHGG